MKRCAVAFALAFGIVPRAEATARAQATPPRAVADSAIFRGVVLNDVTGGALSYAIVTISSLGIERFANSMGQFVIGPVPVGTYRLRVRQLGFSPVNVDVTVAPANNALVTIRMQRLAYKLAAMQVATNWPCSTPGRPQFQKPGSTDVFDQLEQNADRLNLLQQQFPFELFTERRLFTRLDDGPELGVQKDTLVTISGRPEPYIPGKMIFESRDVHGALDHYLQLPTVLSFTEPEFVANHCFLVRGVDTTGANAAIRVDFKPWSKIRSPDVEGSVLLDTANYLLRRSEIRLTKIPREIRGVASVTVTSFYGEVQPGLPVVSQIHALTESPPPKKRNSMLHYIEDQTLFNVRFLKQRPDSVP